MVTLITLDLLHLQADSKVHVDAEAAEKVLIDMNDFLSALENDVKPVCSLVGCLVARFINIDCYV